MSINLINSARDLYSTAQNRANNAATALANQPLLSFSPPTENSLVAQQSLISSVLELKKSEFEAKSAAKVLETDQKTTGALLDVLA